ncbi:hypothetical protein Tco_1494421, partial [Tanacetum coccineum]
ESFVNSSVILEYQENNKSKSDKGYHAVPPPYTWNFIPFKPDLMFMDGIVESENMDVITVVTPSNVKKVESNHEVKDTTARDRAVVSENKEKGLMLLRPQHAGATQSNFDGGFVSFGDGKGRISRKGQAKKKTEPEQEYILIPLCTTDPLISQGPKDSKEDVGMKPTEVNESEASDKGEEVEQDTKSMFERLLQQEKQTNSTNSFN